MNLKQQSPDDEVLQETLCAWRVDLPLPARFQDRVWDRIARKEAQPGVWDSIREAIAQMLARPRVAYAYWVVLLSLGLGAGAWAAQRENTHLDAALGSRYVYSLDPYHGSR